MKQVSYFSGQDHLTGVLSGLPSVPLQQQNTVFGMIQIATQQPSTSEQQQQQQLQDQPQQQDHQHLEFYRVCSEKMQIACHCHAIL